MHDTSIRISGILAFLESYPSYLILGHKEPDGDCIASQLVLASYLESKSKRVALLSAGPFTRTEIAHYSSRFGDKLPSWAAEPGVAAVVLDCSSLSRTGPLGEQIADLQHSGLPVAIIDHHASGQAEAVAVGGTPAATPSELRYVDSTSPAVAFMIQDILESAGYRLNQEEAELLFFGLCTDTGFFRHLDSGSSLVFEAAGRLVAAGASPKEAFEAMNGGKPFASRKLMGELLSRAETSYDGRLIMTWMNLKDQERYGLVGRDSDMLYQLLMTVDGMEVAVVVRQESQTHCTVGFRSRRTVDVAAIAASFGGGGHRLAAGLFMEGLVDDIVPQIQAAFEPVFGKPSA
ncbi:MAG: bifunctional oligoribonuclease/PAP phosphatase NrnA [Clostridia bacterium]|jgi:phosphoesterase RecJ-like protein|nr:bifunctional oligoribonuclease/PAP phosphatase NrnA [Spirochaetia bacterium]